MPSIKWAHPLHNFGCLARWKMLDGKRDTNEAMHIESRISSSPAAHRNIFVLITARDDSRGRYATTAASPARTPPTSSLTALGEPVRRVLQRPSTRRAADIKEFGSLTERSSSSRTGRSSTTPTGHTQHWTDSHPPNTQTPLPTTTTRPRITFGAPTRTPSRRRGRALTLKHRLV